MVIYNVLDHVFSTWSHVAVLRALKDLLHPLSGREIARRSGMSHRSSLQALSALETLGLVTRLRGGRDHLFGLNRDHRLFRDGILPLLEVEDDFASFLEKELSRKLRKVVTSLVVFGSVARREETPASDYDLCLIVHSPSARKEALESVHQAAPEIMRRYGARISPLAFSVGEFREGVRLGKSPMREIVSEGRVLVGRSFREILNGEKGCSPKR